MPRLNSVTPMDDIALTSSFTEYVRLNRMQLNKCSATILVSAIFCLVGGCSPGSPRGIADKRSDFKSFMPMTKDPSSYGFKQVRPFFGHANRAEILRAIESACQGRSKEGSSDFNPRTEAGYYVNCNPSNRQLLNGYVPIDARKRPHDNHE